MEWSTNPFLQFEIRLYQLSALKENKNLGLSAEAFSMDFDEECVMINATIVFVHRHGLDAQGGKRSDWPFLWCTKHQKS